jgi:hypothetical protein
MKKIRRILDRWRLIIPMLTCDTLSCICLDTSKPNHIKTTSHNSGYYILAVKMLKEMANKKSEEEKALYDIVNGK